MARAANRATVYVRVAVRDGQVVRSELQNLGEVGQQALAKLDDAAKKPSAGLMLLDGAVSKAKDSLGGLSDNAGAAGEVLSGLGRGGAIAAAAIGAVVVAAAGLQQAALHAMEFAGAIQDGADKARVTTDTFQALTNVAADVGIEAEAVANAMQRFAVVQSDLATGAKEAATALEVQVGEAGNMETALDLVAQAMARASTDQERLNIATTFFGDRAGPEFARVLEATGYNVQATTERLREMGLIMSNDLVRSAEEAGDKVAESQRRIAVATAEIGAAFAPVHAAAVEFFADLTRWATQSAATMAQWARAVSPAIRIMQDLAVMTGSGNAGPAAPSDRLDFPRTRRTGAEAPASSVRIAAPSVARARGGGSRRTGGGGAAASVDTTERDIERFNAAVRKSAEAIEKSASRFEGPARRAASEARGIEQAETFRAGMSALESQLEAINELIIKIGDNGKDSADRIADALGRALADGKDGFRALADYALRELARIAINQFIVDPFANFLRTSFSSSTLGVLDKLVGSFDIGTQRVARTGLALVHAGEQISTPGMTRASQGQGGLNVQVINMSGAPVSAVTRQDRNRMQIVLRSQTGSDIAAGYYDAALASIQNRQQPPVKG